MKRVCPYCLKTDIVAMESYPCFREQTFKMEGDLGPWAEPLEDHCEYDEGCLVPFVYCPECETIYERCYSPEDAWELMVTQKKESL